MARPEGQHWEGLAGRRPLSPPGGSWLLPGEGNGMLRESSHRWAAICFGDGSAGHPFLKVDELGLILLGGPQVLSGVWSWVVIHHLWS